MIALANDKRVSCRVEFCKAVNVKCSAVQRMAIDMHRGLTMELISILLMMLLYWPGWSVKGQLLPEPIVDTQYGQILGNRKVYEGRIRHRNDFKSIFDRTNGIIEYAKINCHWYQRSVTCPQKVGGRVCEYMHARASYNVAY